MSSTKSNGSPIPVSKFPAINDRIKQLTETFSSVFKNIPQFYVRVPGRVNLIGEHIDYSGYGVCPMALEQDILLAISVEDEAILRIHNMDPNYPPKECNLDKLEISVGEGGPEWHQYFLCGVKGIFDILSSDNIKKGLNVAVNGTIPPSAGLSSSSALVSAAALATAYAHKLTLSKEKIATLCAECERYIGTEGGGMDQAIAFLATEGCAKFIEFSPLRSTDIKLPQGVVFVIAHSLAKLNKAATADYNRRVVECRLAAQLLAHVNLSMDYGKNIVTTLGQFQKATSKDLLAIEELVKQTLHEEPYSKAELERLLSAEGKLEQYSLTPNTRTMESFRLRQRALHVFQEAIRVEKFITICKNSIKEDTNCLRLLGQLMTESHESLRNLYECSHPQLDRLVELSKDVTLGARLTGAGWGGCIVAMVLPENVGKYKEILQREYYRHFGIKDIESVVFVTKPHSGACIYLGPD